MSLMQTMVVSQQPSQNETLFDGQTLRGWEGDPAVWTVEGGCITGRTTAGQLAANTFLIWQGGEVEDFELSFEVRVEGDNNSGVQYRSRRLAGFGVAGPQCDVHPSPAYFGMLYDEGGRGITATRGQQVAFSADGQKRILTQGKEPAAVDLGQWHRLRVVARGVTMQHFVDGELAIEVTDDSPRCSRKGILALQVHSGPAMVVQWRNLELRRLPKVEVALAPAAAAEPMPQPHWIWDESAQDGEELFFRREFELAAAPSAAVLEITCDNHFRVAINGERVANGDAWELPRRVDVRARLRAGRNVIAVHGWNDSGPAGLCALLGWRIDGRAGAVATDASWRVSEDDPDGWDAVGFADSSWKTARIQAPLGGSPWGGALPADAFVGQQADDAPQLPQPTEEFTAVPGWTKELVLRTPRAYGSWVALCEGPDGRLYAADQKRGLFCITPAGHDGRPDSQIERLPVELEGCQGLCFAFSALYAVQNGRNSGLCRITDSDGDGVLDRLELLQALPGNGEHGPHAVALAPDGDRLLVLCGNHTKLPPLVHSRVPMPFAEDALQDRLDDPNGHAVGIEAPGGYVCLVDKDGKDWELLCCGFRNAYDLAVLPDGSILTYDADMEWDMGTPWYRPTRILQALSGDDYGWRTGSAKWGADFPDSLPAVVDIGPGSPTGMAALGGAALALDWTFGTIYQVVPQAGGAGHGMLRGLASVFASGAPWPLCDVVVSQDQRTIWLLTGGRGLPSKLYRMRAEDGGALLAATPRPSAAQQVRVSLEALHREVGEAAIDHAWPRLGDEYAAVRHAARIAVEHQPLALWRQRAFDEDQGGWSRLTAWLALARKGLPEDVGPLLSRLSQLAPQELSAEQRVARLRAIELALLRLGPVATDVAAALSAVLAAELGGFEERLDPMLCGILARLDAPQLLDLAVPMLEAMQPDAAPEWSTLIARNANYGGAIEKMLAAMPPSRQIAIANALRTVGHGWTLAQRRTFFRLLEQARRQKGGASYQGYLKKIVDLAYASCTPAEQGELAELVGAARAEPAPFVSRPPQGPGRSWALDEAAALAKAQLASPRDASSGRNLFHATGCAGCHRFAGEGSGIGPDLTSLGNKFGPADVLEAILDPDKTISDQYSGSIVTAKDGRSWFGRAALAEGGRVYEIVTATATAEVVRVPADEVAKVEPSAKSAMPKGLVDRLNADELLDLLAFLLSRGKN